MLKKQKASNYGLLIVTLGALFYCYEYFLRIAPSVMQVDLMEYFKINATLFGSLSGFYYYAYTPMQLVVGVMLDRYKTKNVIAFAILCCTFGSILFSSTPNYELAALGRFLQGFGSAFAFIGALKLASRWLPVWWFASFSGTATTLGFLGGATGDILLTHMMRTMDWQSLLHIFVILGFILTVVFWLCMSIKLKNPVTFDQTEMPPLTLKEAIIQLLALFKNKYLWTAGILGGLLFLPTIVFADLWGIPYLQDFHGYSLTKAGFACSMIYFGWAIGSPVQGVISNLLNKRLRVILYGAVLSAIFICLVMYIQALPFIGVCFLLLLFGIASSVECLTFAMGADVCTPRTTAMTMAFINFFVMLSGLFMQRAVGWLLDFSWTGTLQNGIRVYTSQDYQHAMVVVPISLILAAILALIMRDKPLRLK